MSVNIYISVNNYNLLKIEKQIICFVGIKILASKLYSVGDLKTNKYIYFDGCSRTLYLIDYFDRRQNIIFGRAQNQNAVNNIFYPWQQ